MINFKVLLLLLQLSIIISAKTYVIIDEKQERCVVDGYDNDFETFDYSNFHIIPENDTHTFINGSLKALLDIKTPWYIHVHTEHYERGKWLLQAFTRTYKDFCPEFKNSLQVWYYITKNYKGCVIPKGNIFEYDMISLSFDEVLLRAIPNHYVGKWRAVVHGMFTVDGVEKLDCKRYYANVYIE